MIRIENLTRIPDPLTRLERYMEFQDGKVIPSTDPKIMLLFDYDPVEFEDGLNSWAKKYKDICSVLSVYPLAITVSGKYPHGMVNLNIHIKLKMRIEKVI